MAPPRNHRPSFGRGNRAAGPGGRFEVSAEANQAAAGKVRSCRSSRAKRMAGLSPDRSVWELAATTAYPVLPKMWHARMQSCQGFVAQGFFKGSGVSNAFDKTDSFLGAYMVAGGLCPVRRRCRLWMNRTKSGRECSGERRRESPVHSTKTAQRNLTSFL